VLPCPVDTFKRQSVSFAGPEWEQRFHHVPRARHDDASSPVPRISARAKTDPTSTIRTRYANRVLTGLAVLQAQALDFDLKALAVWDGAPAVRPGGTGDLVAEWSAAPAQGRTSFIRPTVASTTPAAPEKKKTR